MEWAIIPSAMRASISLHGMSTQMWLEIRSRSTSTAAITKTRAVINSINILNLRNPPLFIDLCSQPTSQVASKKMINGNGLIFVQEKDQELATHFLLWKVKNIDCGSYFKCNNFINLDRRHGEFDDAAGLLELDLCLCPQKRCSLDLHLARKLNANHLVTESNWLAHASAEGIRAVVVEHVHGEVRFRLPCDHFHESFALHVNGIVIA